jgi:aspartate/methionine/tyrosine aminotransferase
MQLANRLFSFQSNVFAEMDQAKQLARQKGQKIIDLSLGSSDLPVSPRILDRSLTPAPTAICCSTAPVRFVRQQRHGMRKNLA